MIRLAEKKDLSDLVVLGRDSFEFGGLSTSYEYNDDIARQEFEVMIDDPARFIMVLDTDEGIKGMMAAVAFNGLCGSAITTYEQYIYIDESHRGGRTLLKFLSEYNKWGEAIGAKLQFLVSHTQHEKLSKVYSRYGYEDSERTYIRRIK